MAARFCVECGAALVPGAGSCARCGAEIRALEPGPAAQELPAPPPPAPAAGLGTKTWLYGAIAVGVAVVLVGGVLVATGGGEDEAPGTAPGEVFLEPADFPGDAPFTESVDTNTAPPPVQLVASTSSASPSVSVSPSPSGSGDVGVRSVQGVAPGLYGGTQDESACDAAKLVEFLMNEPAKARAWAAVQGIAPEDIPAFVAGLTPIVLRADTRVTNHGYEDGRATPLQSVLQAGTAVLVDDLGIPRVKCGCGNPLAPPQAQTQGVRYTGRRWPGFRPPNVIVIVNTNVIRVKEFVLVDLGRPGYFVRPVGIPAPGTPPADGEVLTDSLCDLFPEDCQPPNPDEPVLGTGDVQVTLRWSSTADLDLAVVDPSGELVDYEFPTSSSGGQLDVDSNGGCERNVTTSPVENVFWPPGQSLDGAYRVIVTYFSECPGGTGPQTFELTVLTGGVPMTLQPLVADGNAGSTFTVLVTSGEPRLGLYSALAQTEATLNPGEKYEGGFEKSPPPTEPPPTEQPPSGEQPVEPQPMTLEEYCKDLFPEPPEWVIGPENMNYTLCMHDPTSAVDLDPVPFDPAPFEP